MPNTIEPCDPQETATAVMPDAHEGESSAAYEATIETRSRRPPRNIEHAPTHNPFTELPTEMRKHLKTYLSEDDKRALAFTSRQQLQEGVQSGDHLRKPVIPMRLWSGEALADRLLSSKDRYR